MRVLGPPLIFKIGPPSFLLAGWPSNDSATQIPGPHLPFRLLLGQMSSRYFLVCGGEWKPILSSKKEAALSTAESPLTLFIIMVNRCIKMSIWDLISVKSVYLAFNLLLYQLQNNFVFLLYSTESFFQIHFLFYFYT